MHLDDYNCVLYNAGVEETSFPLFIVCPFSQACWDSIPISWDTSLPPLDMMIDARSKFGHSIFREIVIIACWKIWTTHNRVIFDNGHVNLNLWKNEFKE